MSNPVTGGCACKAIRFVYDGAPVLSYKCHCRDCQVASGGGGVGLMWVWLEHFEENFSAEVVLAHLKP